MRRTMLIDASWPSNRLAAVMNRTWRCARSALTAGRAERSVIQASCYPNRMPQCNAAPGRGSGGFLVLGGRPAARVECLLHLTPARSDLLHGCKLDVAKAPDLLRQAGELDRQREIVRREFAQRGRDRSSVRLDELAL